VNFDCVGRGEKLIISYNDYASKLISKIKSINLNNNVYFAKDYYLNESDQYPFHVHENPFYFS